MKRKKQTSSPIHAQPCPKAFIRNRTTPQNLLFWTAVVSVNLAPNVGATPAGEFYTAVYYMSDGSTSTQYWVVPAAASASLAQVQAQVMPAAQAVQAVSKAYVDQAITELAQSSLTASGGTLSGPLYLSADPTQPLQAADKHYVDVQVATAVPLAGGNMTGALTSPAVERRAGAERGERADDACRRR